MENELKYTVTGCAANRFIKKQCILCDIEHYNCGTQFCNICLKALEEGIMLIMERRKNSFNKFESEVYQNV